MMRVPPSREVVEQQTADLEELIDALLEVVWARRRGEAPMATVRHAIAVVPREVLDQLVGMLLFEVADARPIR